MQCLPPDKRTEVNLQWFKSLVDSWTPSQEQRNLCDLPAAVRPKPMGATKLKKAMHAKAPILLKKTLKEK